MSIRVQSRRGGFFLAGAVAGMLMLIGLAVQHIRVGGTVDSRNDVVSGFTADIMPPPLYIVEPMFLARQAMDDPPHLAGNRITVVEGIAGLPRLNTLNLAKNALAAPATDALALSLDEKNLPQRIRRARP